MVQSLKLGGAVNEEAGSSMRRINRLPLIATGIGVLLFLAIVFFALINRGLLQRGDPGPDAGVGSLASSFADQIKRGVSDGIIGESHPAQTFQPTPTETREETSANPFTSQPAQQEEAQSTLEPEEVWRARLEREQREQYLRERHRQKMAQLQASNAAYDAPLAINGGVNSGHSRSASVLPLTKG